MIQESFSNKKSNRNLRIAKVVQVIETEEVVGEGTKECPCYLEHLYWSPDGKLLAVGIDSP